MIRNLLTFSAQTKDNENTKRQSIEEISTDINSLAKNLRSKLRRNILYTWLKDCFWNNIFHFCSKFKNQPIHAGIEPAIFCSVGRRVIHCATGPLWNLQKIKKFKSGLLQLFWWTNIVCHLRSVEHRKRNINHSSINCNSSLLKIFWFFT